MSARERFRVLPVNIRACRMGELVHFFAQGSVIRKRARIPAGFKLAFRIYCHNCFNLSNN